MVLNWTAVSGKNYQILSTTNLSNPVWLAVFPGSVRPAVPRRLAASDISPSRPRIHSVTSAFGAELMDTAYEQIIPEPIGSGSPVANRFRPGVYLD